MNRILNDNTFSSQLRTIDERFQPQMIIVAVAEALVRIPNACATGDDCVRVCMHASHLPGVV